MVSRPSRIGRQLVPLAALLLAMGLGAGCGGGDTDDVAELRAENERLKARLDEDATNASGTPGDDDWAWARDDASRSGTAAGSTAEPATQQRVIEPERSTPPPARSTTPRTNPPRTETPAPTTNKLEPRPAQAAPTPEPEPARRVAAAGASLEATLSSGVSSETASVGERVEARLSSDLRGKDGEVVLPAGTLLVGQVTEVQAAKKVKKKSRLAFRFDEARLPDGRTAAVSAGLAVEGRGYTKKDGAVIGGSAAGGALLGQVLGGDSEATAAGAVIGGAIGSGVVLSKRGEEAELPAGTSLQLTLERDVTVEVPRG